MGKFARFGRIMTIIAATALLTSCAGSPAEVPAITSIEYSQSQAIPNFDNTTHTTSDPADIKALSALLDEHGVTGSYSNSTDAACAGARSTDVAYTTASDAVVTLKINGNCKETAFDEAIDDLVSGWRTAN